MSNPTKQQTIRRALESLRQHYDAATARFATLGGAGYELDVWAALGVPRDHCWLIERDERKAQQLIPRARPAHVYVGELRDFPSVFRSVHPGGTLDVFHWDLCETVEPNARELRHVFPVIAGSERRCLLVTAADQRSNRSLDEADLIDAWWTWLLGGAETYRAFRRHLEGGHDAARRREWTEAEPVNATTRELSALLHVLLVLADFRWEEEAVTRGRAMGLAALDRTRATTANHRPVDIAASFAGGREPSVTFVPDELIRFVYYSRAHTAIRPGFRMRTMGMHLARLERPIPIRDAAARIAMVVTNTPLQMVVPGSRGRIKIVTVRGPRTTEFTMSRPAAASAPDVAPPPQAAVTSKNPYGDLAAQVDAFGADLAQRLRAVGHDPKAVVALSERAKSALGGLESIAVLVQAAEDTAHVQDRLRETLAAATGNGVAVAPAVAGSGDLAAPPPASDDADSGAAGPLAKKRHRKLTIDDRTALTVRLLRAKHVRPEQYAAELVAVKDETGLNGRAVAACLARTNGKFRNGFIRRAIRSVSVADWPALAAELESFGFGPAKQLLRTARSG